jgi:hypothetical protein
LFGRQAANQIGAVSANVGLGQCLPPRPIEFAIQGMDIFCDARNAKRTSDLGLASAYSICYHYSYQW